MNKYFVISLFMLLLASCGSPATQDLFVSSVSNQATADAALQQAQLQKQFLTATAEAPIIHITETAAAYSVAQTQAAADLALQQRSWTTTAQSIQETQTAAMTATAMAWTPTPNATSTAMFAVLNAQSTQIALELQRQEISNQFWAILPGVFFILLICAAIMGLIWVSRRERYRPPAVDERGRILPMFDYVEGTITDPDRMPNYRGDLREKWLQRWLMERLNIQPQLPAVTPERQDAATQRAQLTDLATRGLPGSSNNSPQKRAVAQEMTKQLSAPNLEGRFKILGPEANDIDIVDPQIIEVLDADWKEAQQS